MTQHGQIQCPKASSCFFVTSLLNPHQVAYHHPTSHFSLKHWRNNPDFIDRAVYAWPPGDDAEFAMNVLLKTMKGQGLKMQSILVPPYEEDVETIQSFVPEDCDRNSSEFRTVGIENWASDDYLNNFFDNGEPLI